MAISIKPNQALGFNVNDDCKCGGNYCQPIQTTDITMLQGFVTAGSAINLVSDGDFDASTNWSLDAGWSIASGKLTATNIGGGSTADSVAALGLAQNKLYLVQCSFDVTSVGSATSGFGFQLSINGQSLALPNAVAGYNADLTATWLFKAGAITTDIVSFSTNESTIDFDVLYIKIYEVSEVGLGIYNNSGILEDSYTTFTGDNSLKYYFNGAQFTTGSAIYVGDYSYSADLVMFELLINNWASLTDYVGCLTVSIYDTLLLTQRVRNGTFTGNTDYWTLGAGWIYSANTAAYVTGMGLLTQQLSLSGGLSYTLSFTVSFLGSNYMALYINGVFVENFRFSGAKTYTLDLSAYSGATNVTIGFSGSSLGDSSYSIDSVSLVAADKDRLNVSECINLRVTHTCTLLFYAYNTDNAFGFDYTSGALRHYLRLEARIDLVGFPEEKEVYKFSDNSRSLLFAESDSEYEVKTFDAPDYIHACLRQMRLNDFFKIGTIDYVADGAYDLKSRKTSKLKQAVFTVKEADGISSNYSCS
jgi:hypothetical protein